MIDKTKKFIEEAKLKHGEKYLYDKVNYIKTSSKVIITCLIHGDFIQSPNTHLSGSGCRKCYSDKYKTNNEEFIKEIIDIHKNNKNLTFDKVKYENARTNVIITCLIHGDYETKPSNIRNGCICRKCFYTKKINNQEDYLNKCREKHNNYYDYSKSFYKSTHEKMIIICPAHGEFEQEAVSHLTGSGCSECHFDKITKTTEKFIEEANLIHNNLYDYSKTKYINNAKKIIIICKEHGEFKQTPNKHLNSRGCPNCYKSKGSIKIKNILDINNIEYIEEMKFDDCRNKNSLPFDFYLPKLNTCIEFDGLQHFESINFWGGEKRLNYTKNNDEIKNKYCENNNIKLLRIPYYEIDKIADILLNIFNI